MNEQRDTFVPDLTKLQKELGPTPKPVVSKPEDYAPKKENKAPYISQAIKVILHGAPRWHNLSVGEQEALDLIATTISYILTGEKDTVMYWDAIEKQASGVE